MKKQEKKQAKRIVPAFATEAEEADGGTRTATFMASSFLLP
jgi:hypothetical protein